jgi:glycosyltransferase involved in cell wall biosynthesis
MRIAYLTQWFEPEPNIVKGVAFVRALEAAGHQVTVFTGFPNYPRGKLYPGYRLHFLQREKIDGVTVVRLPLYPSHDHSSIRRSLNFLSFFVSLLVYLLMRRSRFDLAYVYHPPITVGLAAAIADLFRPLPFVLDVQDLWPDTIAATGMAGASRISGLLAACCRFVYRRASAVVTQSNGIREALIARGVPAEKVSVVHNWADAEFREIPKANGESRAFNLVYGGNLGRAQQLETLLEAAAILSDKPDDIRITLFGSGIEEAGLRERAEALDNVRFAGRVPQRDMIYAFAKADALVLHLRDNPLFDITIPSKTQFYLAMGRPIIAGLNGEAAAMLRESGAAIVVPSADAKALAEAIEGLARLPSAERKRMGRNGRDYYQRNLSFQRGMERTIALLEGTHQRAMAGRISK